MNNYHPEGLPENQPAIETQSLVNLRKALNILLTSKGDTGYAMMGAITGNPGLGKTIAVNSFVEKIAPQPHIAPSPIVLFRVPESPTPRSLAWSLLAELGEKSTGTSYEIKRRIVEVLRDGMYKLVIADEADYLKEDTFDNTFAKIR